MASAREPRYTWVFFDLGGTLVDERDFPSWIDLGRELGIEISEDHLAHAFLEVNAETDTAEPPPALEWWRRVLERASGAPVAPELVEMYLERWYARPRTLPIFSDTRRCLVQLRDEGRALGVISNSRSEERVREILNAAGIETFFGVVVSSGAEGVAKPDPEIFRRAAERARVPLARAFYVGDLAYRDARAAARAGMASVWLHRDGWGFGDDPPEITSLTELPFYLRQLESAPAVAPVK